MNLFNTRSVAVSTLFKKEILVYIAPLMINQETFTNQEITVIQLICQQYFDADIAKEISVSVRDVQKIRKNIMSKMKVKGSVGIVVFAIKYNIYHV